MNMMFPSLLFTLVCCILTIVSVQGINLYSSSTREEDVQAAYTITVAKAKTEYSSLVASVSTKSSFYCANGPYYKYYYKPGYLYWPPIRYRSCDGLVCSHPGKCVVTSSRVVYRWAVVFRCYTHYCYLIGIRYIRFVEHLGCQCRECTTNADCPHPQVCNRFTYKCEEGCVHQSCPPRYYFDYSICGCVRIDIELPTRPEFEIP